MISACGGVGMHRTAHLNSAASKLKTFLIASICCFFILLLLFMPKEALKGARTGLTLCAEIVIPSLFPFLALTTFIIQSGLAQKAGSILEPFMRKVFQLPGSAATAIFLGVIGGYPVGAKATAELCKTGALTKKQGERLLCFCINSGPAFIIGAVGAGMLKSTAAGLILYGVHIFSSLLIGISMRFFSGKIHDEKPAKRQKAVPPAAAFVGSVTGAATSMLYISAFVVFFSAINGLLNQIGVFSCAAKALSSFLPVPANDPLFFNRALAGLLEVTNGCALAAGSSGIWALVLISVVLSWSGISVICQVMASVQDAGLSVSGYVAARIAHMILSALLTYVIFMLFPTAVPVFAAGPVIVTGTMHSAPACVALLVICTMLLLSQLTI